MELKLGKKDLVWGYFAQFFSIATGILILPIILKLLSPEEVGLNYLMLTIGVLVTLFDFGFAPQFGRNITYIFSGSQNLLKEGVEQNTNKLGVNYKLLFVMIQTAKFLYKRLSLIILILLLTLGTVYIYEITNGFNTVKNSLFIWLTYCISIYFNMYFAYYSSLLNGRGMVTEYRKALVYSKTVYTVISLILLLLNLGLISIVIANLITPFVVKFFSHKFFFTEELNQKLEGFKASKEEKLELIEIIWHNAKKLGLVYLGSFAITKVGMFIAGLFLSLDTIASYGLMVQLVSLIAIVATTISTLYQPRIASLRILNSKSDLLNDFSYTVVIFKILFIVGSLLFVSIGNYILNFMGSATVLPSIPILILYCLVVFLETNHSLFSSFLVTNNEIPFVRATLIAGIVITILTYLLLKFTNLNLLSIVLVPLLVQLAYNNWKWPYVVCNYFQVNYLDFIIIGIKNVKSQIKKLRRNEN
jgi:O-antigen/teichoic acid export membrane protein